MGKVRDIESISWIRETSLQGKCFARFDELNRIWHGINNLSLLVYMIL